ncbi:MAG TPA: hypothetical protein VNK82_03180 [Terriglobales bacterium]|nr:hypothetical protein [Terriglobales bacterium]
MGFVVAVAFSLRLGAAFEFRSLFWSDEIFQTLEPAHRLAYGYGITTWEWREGTRSWVLPAVLAGIMRVSGGLAPGSSGYLLAITVCLCLLSLLPVIFAYVWARRVSAPGTGLLAAALSAVWFELIFFAPKAFSEVILAHVFLAGLLLATTEDHRKERGRLLAAGIMFGITLALRVPYAPVVGFAVIYLCRRQLRQKWLPLALGLAVSVVAFGMIDAFSLGSPFQSLWKLGWIDLAESKSLQFGSSPWYAYLASLVWVWSWGFPLIVYFVALGAPRSPLLLWLVAVLFVTHSFLEHKEYRYLYLMVPLVCTLAALGMAQWAQRFPARRRAVIAGLLAAWCLGSGLLAWNFRPYWTAYSGNLRAFEQMSRSGDTCGVGLLGMPWNWTGGYAYLHRDVPILQLEVPGDAARLSPHFNYLLAFDGASSVPEGFERQWCWRGSCLFTRPGDCTPAPGYHINRVLQQRGQ